MNMKKTYRRPQTRSIALQGPRLMLTASVEVNEYRSGNGNLRQSADTDADRRRQFDNNSNRDTFECDE